MTRQPITHKDNGETLGYIEQDSTGWTGQTVFGYVFARDTNKQAIEDTVRAEGVVILKGMWQYYDKDEKSWFPCIIKEAYPGRVVVVRTSEMGYQYGDDHKVVTILNPSETNLVKS